MKRNFVVAIAVVVLSTAAALGLIAQDQTGVEKTELQPESFGKPAPAAADETAAKRAFISLAEKYADVANMQELHDARNELTRKLTQANLRRDADAKEKEADKFLQDAEKSLKDAEASLRNVLKLYPTTEAAKRAEGRLISVGKKP